MPHPIDLEMSKAVKDGVFPSASLLVGKGENILWEKVYGKATPDTLFDIASLTKPVCTATLCMMAVKEGKMNLDEMVRDGITVRHLLNHTSGLPAYKKYYLEYSSPLPGPLPQGEREKFIKRIWKEPLEQAPGEKTVYSDLGYIVLGTILEKIYGKGLDQLFSEKIAHPFGLQHTFFIPSPSRGEGQGEGGGATFAATEQCAWRKKLICGEVMDEHAYLMGGAAGHAGLFSTAADLRKWILKMDALRTQKIAGPFLTVPKKRPQTFFTLGFDTPSSPSSSGKYFSLKSLGHLGYSGCSFWWDLEKNFFVILLTNRVHPSRDNEKIKAFRPHLHDVIRESLGSL